MGLVVLVVRAVGLGETLGEQDDERAAGFAQGATDLLLALGYSSTDMYDAVLSSREAFVTVGVDLGLREPA